MSQTPPPAEKNVSNAQPYRVNLNIAESIDEIVDIENLLNRSIDGENVDGILNESNSIQPVHNSTVIGNQDEVMDNLDLGVEDNFFEDVKGTPDDNESMEEKEEDETINRNHVKGSS